jgi:nucleoside-diphosphate-sugar epimerase
MNCLVTGGAGFIPSHLVDRLLEEGNKVIVIDDFSTGKQKNLEHQKGNQNLTVYNKSICENLNKIFDKEKVETVFHLAAMPRVQFSIKYPKESHEVNVNGTLNLLLTCKKHQVKRFIYTSSSSVYGDQQEMPEKETMTPKPISPYALQKLVGEKYCYLFNLLYGMETISLRNFNVFGPRLDPEGEYATLIPKFIWKIKNGETPIINGDGEQTRDMVYVSDVVEANMLAAKTQNKECFGQVFNIGSGKSYSVNKVTQLILKLSKSNIKPKHGPPVVEPKHTRADVSKAKRLLGWSPKVSFEEGLKRTYDYFNKHLTC